MKSFELKLFSLKQSKVLKIESQEEVDEYFAELISNFAYQVDHVERRVSVEPLQVNNSALRENIAGFIERYKSNVPQVHQLGSFIKSLEDGEYFYIFPNVQLETSHIMGLSNHLQALNKGLDIKIVQDEFTSLFGKLLDNYNMFSFSGESRTNVGVSDRTKAICRFCRRGEPAVKFSNKSHAISEALGNKGIVCNDECDSCNAKFGSGVETDLIAFLSLYRAFFGIKGKGSGTPKLKGKNFSVKKAASGEVAFSIIGEELDFPGRIEAHTHEKVSSQNIYRALCKYVISVLPGEELKSMGACIDWINQTSHVESVPPIYLKIINELYSEYPSLSVYIRKNDDKEIPHVAAEFRFASIVIVFVLPCSGEDNNAFLGDSDMDKFWGISHYSRHGKRSDWAKLKLDSDEKRELRFSINFEQRA